MDTVHQASCELKMPATSHMHKSAEVKTTLLPHQQRALQRAVKGNLLLAHSVGAGKTLTSIAIADKLGKPTTVITPAALVENYKKELAKHLRKGTGPRFTVLSLPKAVKDDYQVPEGDTLVLDEVHSFRNAGTAKQRYIKNQVERAGRVIGLTGTPAYNNITDWAPLVNIVAAKQVVPENPGDFRKRYIREDIVWPTHAQWRQNKGVKPGVVERLQNADDLKKRIMPYVDIFDNLSSDVKRRDVVVETGMSPDQLEMYEALDKKLPSAIQQKIRLNIPPSRTELADMNALLTGVRQVSNTAEGFYKDADTGVKITEAVKHLKKAIKDNPKLRALVYTNYIGSGVGSYAKVLDKEGIPYGLYTGALSGPQKHKLVTDYNKALGAAVLLVSGAGSEGLDLKNTRLIQLLEPHWNNSRLEQVVGRGIRYKSHDSLPPDQRNVLVEHYEATLPDEQKFFGLLDVPRTSVDVYMRSRADEKQRLIDDLKKTLM